METDLSLSDSTLNSVSFRKTRDISTGYKSDRFETADYSYLVNLHPWQLPDPAPKKYGGNPEDLNALREWVNAKLDRERGCNKMHVNIQSTPWRVG